MFLLHADIIEYCKITLLLYTGQECLVTYGNKYILRSDRDEQADIRVNSNIKPYYYVTSVRKLPGKLTQQRKHEQEAKRTADSMRNKQKHRTRPTPGKRCSTRLLQHNTL